MSESDRSGADTITAPVQTAGPVSAGDPTASAPPSTGRRRRKRSVFLARRGAMVKAHRWLSFLLLAWIVVECLTGSLIVFADEIDRAWDTSAYTTTPGDVGLADAMAAARDARPDDSVRFATVPSTDTGGMYEVWLTDAGAEYHEVLVDPGSGVVTDRDHHVPWLVGLAERLHVTLNSTSVFGIEPITVLGWLGIGWLAVLLSGFYVWYWPGVRRWARALRVRTGRGWFTFNLDLHKAIGIVAFVPLLLVAVTGIRFAFPGQVRDLWDVATFGSMQDTGSRFPTSTPMAGARQIDADAARDLAASIDPSLEVTSVTGPGGSAVGTWTVAATADASFLGAAGGARTIEIAIDQYTGSVTAIEDPADDDWATRAYEEWSNQIHFGTFGGTTTRVLWVVVGLSPVVLAATGAAMWLARRSKRAARVATR